MTENINKKPSRFDKLKNISDANIMKREENITSPEASNTKVENREIEISSEKISSDEKSLMGPGLKFNQPSLTKSEKKSKKIKTDQIKDRVTIVVSEPTRDRLKVFCASNKFVIQNWTDEMLWKAMDRVEKAQREQREKKV